MVLSSRALVSAQLTEAVTATPLGCQPARSQDPQVARPRPVVGTVRDTGSLSRKHGGRGVSAPTLPATAWEKDLEQSWTWLLCAVTLIVTDYLVCMFEVGWERMMPTVGLS